MTRKLEEKKCRRILLLSASAGAGHVRAAQALEVAMKKHHPDADVIHVDALEYASPIFRHVYSRGYISMVNKAPKLLGMIYDHFDRPGAGENGRLIDEVNALPLLRLITKTNPDLIVSTHFFPAEIVSILQSRGQIHCPQAVVVTDFDMHALWQTTGAAAYFVALDETAKYLESMGVPAERIIVSGIPVDPAFAVAEDKKQVRNELGLAPDRTTILVSAGGYGVGPVRELLSRLCELEHPAQLLIMCGSNASLKQRMEKIKAVAPRHLQIEIVGYTKEMHRYMAASDLIVGKPGGLTTSEALSKGLGFVIVNPIPGQEERNASHLLENGAAIRANNLSVLAFKIDRLLADPAKVEQMCANARAMARPLAAHQIALVTGDLMLAHPAKEPRRPGRLAKAVTRLLPKKRTLAIAKR